MQQSLPPFCQDTDKCRRNERISLNLERFLGSTGGPSQVTYQPGRHPHLTDPATGKAKQKMLADILKSGNGFDGIGGTSFTAPPSWRGPTPLPKRPSAPSDDAEGTG
jgi:hypothetical protein